MIKEPPRIRFLRLVAMSRTRPSYVWLVLAEECGLMRTLSNCEKGMADGRATFPSTG